jgi:hypothetical protein
MAEDTYMFNMRMVKEDKKKLEELAEANNRSMSSQIIWMIRQDWILLMNDQIKQLKDNRSIEQTRIIE